MRKDILVTLREQLLTRTALESIPEGVWKRTGALNTWGTNAIEGNTLSRADVERILLEQKSVGNRPLSDVMETIRSRSAVGCISRSSPSIPSATATVELDGCFSTCISSNTAGRRSIFSRRIESATFAVSCGDTRATSPI